MLPYVPASALGVIPRPEVVARLAPWTQLRHRGGSCGSEWSLIFLEQGREVGELARQLFAGGVEVKSGDPKEAIRMTRELLANPDVPAIFEAAFENGGVLVRVVRVDILQRRRNNRWQLIEVKSTADLREEHLDDVGIQVRVVSRSGLDVASSCLMSVNRDYVSQGGPIDVRQFFRNDEPNSKSRGVAAEAHFSVAVSIPRARHA